MELEALLPELPRWDGHEIDVRKLSQVFNKVTNSYKYLWFLALLNLCEQRCAVSSITAPAPQAASAQSSRAITPLIAAPQQTLEIPQLQVLCSMVSLSFRPITSYHIYFGVLDTIDRTISSICKNVGSMLHEILLNLNVTEYMQLDEEQMIALCQHIFEGDNLYRLLAPLIDLKKLDDTKITALMPTYTQLLTTLLPKQHRRKYQAALETKEDKNAAIIEPVRRMIAALPEILEDIDRYNINVPWRFISPWLSASTEATKQKQAADIRNGAPYCLYKDRGQSKTQTTVLISATWLSYLLPHTEILRNFTYCAFTAYLEKRNPLLPALLSKISEVQQERDNLNQQRQYFNAYLKSGFMLHSVYFDEYITVSSDYALDHFIPWSFVHHNYIWNLTPLDQARNSSKSDHLPPLEPCIENLGLQHKSLLQFHVNAALRSRQAVGNKKGETAEEKFLDKFREDFLTISKGKELVDLVAMSDKAFCDLIADQIRPAYQVAQNQGFTPWRPPILEELKG